MAANQFDFEFGADSRAGLLRQAERAVAGVNSPLSGGSGAAAADAAALQLLQQMDAEVAEFGVYPEIVPLRASDFEKHGLQPPARFVDLSVGHRFFWVRLPMTLKARGGRRFVKLQCAVEFNPGSDPGHLRPVAQMILPDRRFQQLLQTNTRLTVGIGEDFEFKAEAAGDASLPGGSGSAKLGVDAKLAAGAGLAAGPFTYTWNRAKVDHTGTGTEKVFWTLDGAEFFEEQEPVLVVVLRVPLALTELRIAAALQASHGFSLLASSLGEALDVLGDRLLNFFRAGAPTTHTRTWDLTPSLASD